ncbi:MAG: ATP-binding protein [Candidatus Ornithospirochaeta sp.]
MTKNDIQYTDDWVANGIKILVYGPTGSGKTYAMSTCPRPFIINVATESGLLSLRKKCIPYKSVGSLEELEDVINFLVQEENWNNFDTLCIDSLSEIAEVCLSEQKGLTKDGRKAYAMMADEMMERIRDLISIPGKNLYCICKQKKLQDDEGRMLFSPDVPGQAFAQKIPYYFDEVFAFRMMRDANKNLTRRLQTVPDERYDAKDRSGDLDLFEEPDITQIINKIS